MASISISFLNGAGNGYAETLEYPEGTTLGHVLSQKLGTTNPSNFKLRVRRGDEVFGKASNPATSGMVLQSGDKISAIPAKPDAGRMIRRRKFLMTE